MNKTSALRGQHLEAKCVSIVLLSQRRCSRYKVRAHRCRGVDSTININGTLPAGWRVLHVANNAYGSFRRAVGEVVRQPTCAGIEDVGLSRSAKTQPCSYPSCTHGSSTKKYQPQNKLVPTSTDHSQSTLSTTWTELKSFEYCPQNVNIYGYTTFAK